MTFLLVLYVGGFAVVLTCFAILQVQKLFEDGEVAPKEAWPYVFLLAVLWPILGLLYIVGSLVAPARSDDRNERR
jgi:hypothetical protein